jgi:hypothetical protein
VADERTAERKDWYIEARIGSDNFRGDRVRYIRDYRREDGTRGYVNMPAEQRMAELLSQLASQAAEIEKLRAIAEAPAPTGCDACLSERARLRSLIEEAAQGIEDDEEDECAYGDGCPDFTGSRHGRCRPCKTRIRPTRLRSALKGE